MKPTGPLFKWFGSKWLSSRLLPKPEYNDIFEPFAGGAGYSLRHADKNVVLAESNVYIHSLWDYIIHSAKESDIREIPLNVPEGTDIRTLGLTGGQQLLLKNWQRTNNVGNCWTISAWGNKPGQWTANTRARVAEEIQCVKHWRIVDDAFNLMGECATKRIAATYIVDPPYMYNYQYGSPPTDYKELAALCRNQSGQVIVCEAICQKTGAVPDWLPFEFFGERITSRRGADNNHHSKELLWQKKV